MTSGATTFWKKSLETTSRLLIGSGVIIAVILVVIVGLFVGWLLLFGILIHNRSRKTFYHDQRYGSSLIEPPSLIRRLFGSTQSEHIQLVSGVYLNVNPPVGLADLLNPLLPGAPEAYGDFREMYRKTILPRAVADFGRTIGQRKANRWLRRRVNRCLWGFLSYRIITLLFTEDAWRPPKL